MIEVQDLCRRYGAVRAIDGISFQVAAGEVLGILGPNGAGKTTTMRILSGSLGATSGSARVAGFDVASESRQVRKHIGYLPEVPPLYSAMTVTSYLDYAARLRGVPAGERPGSVSRAMARAGLESVAGRLIEHLSKGFRQRVGIAQALVHDPPVLILDEPTSGLDPAQVVEIRALLNELRGQHTVVLSTHILSEVTASCDRVIIIAEGRLAAAGTEDELRSALGAGHRHQVLVARPDEGCRAALAAVAGVEDVLQSSAHGFVLSTGTQDLREQINAAAVPFGLLESRPYGGLEELYLQAVATTQAADAGSES
jgi:ABC-2 type transport system ATP-binding protein